MVDGGTSGVPLASFSRPVNAQLKPVSLSSPIADRLDWASRIFRRFKDHLAADSTSAGLLSRLRSATEASSARMLDSGLVQTCAECETLEGGSCCGRGLEDHYDGYLLLINLLLGVNLPAERRDPRSCYFLGLKGCVLSARHVLCVNYLCRKATDRIDSKALALLRELEGVQLEALFLLHERVRKLVKELEQ
jgi:hypothetical protein